MKGIQAGSGVGMGTRTSFILYGLQPPLMAGIEQIGQSQHKGAGEQCQSNRGTDAFHFLGSISAAFFLGHASI